MFRLNDKGKWTNRYKGFGSIIAVLGLAGIAGVVIGIIGPGETGNVSTVVFGALTAILAAGALMLLIEYRKLGSRARELAKKVNLHPDVSSKQAFSDLGDVIDRLNHNDRDHYFIRLMKDKSPDHRPILAELVFYGVDFHSEGFILVSFNACRLQVMNSPHNIRTRDCLVRDVLEEMLPKDLSAYVLDLEDLYIVLFNVPYETETAGVRKIKKEMETYALRAIKEIEERFDLRTSASVSELHRGVESLPNAYLEVQGLFEYRNITGSHASVLHYMAYYISFESWYEFGSTYNKFDEVRQLITSIQVGDFANAKLLINDLIENDYSRKYPTLILARCRLYGIIDAAINAMGLLKEELDEDFLRELNPATRIVNCDTYSELQRELDTIFDAIIDYYSRKKKDSPPEWFETIQTYIDKHYNDMDINVATIADHFKISSAYYARVFKKYTGMSPLDYIHKLRMRSAKRLMGKGVSVKDAATIVGYGSPITMSRAFKRYEGVTPGSYIKR